MNVIVPMLTGLIALWGWHGAFQVTTEEETEDQKTYGFWVDPELALVALAASVACVVSLWNA